MNGLEQFRAIMDHPDDNERRLVEHRDAQTRWRAELERRRKAAVAAIERRPGERRITGLVDDYLIALNSEDRAEALWNLSEALSPKQFWKTVAWWWISCDATWPYRRKALRLMRVHVTFAPAQLRGSLDDEWTVYRGCSRDRIRGIAWTLDRRVAESFAHGHRLIRARDPVIASARIKRASVFIFPRGRREREVVLDPGGLTKIRIAFQPCSP